MIENLAHAKFKNTPSRLCQKLLGAPTLIDFFGSGTIIYNSGYGVRVVFVHLIFIQYKN